MNKSEKHELGQDKSIPLPTRSSMLYGSSKTTRALVLAIPVVGSSLDMLFSEKGNEFLTKRIDIYLKELNQRLSQVEQNQISCDDEEALFDFMLAVHDLIIKTRAEEKLKYFARLTAECFVSIDSWDEAETAVRLISELTEQHIKILKICAQAPKIDIPHGGKRIVYFNGENNLGGALSLAKELPKLSVAARTMYCSELIAKGLLKDEGVGRSDTKALEMLLITELGDWLLDKIAEQNS